MNWKSRAYIDQLQLLGPSSQSSQKYIERKCRRPWQPQKMFAYIKKLNTSNNSHSQPAAILYKIYTVSDVVHTLPSYRYSTGKLYPDQTFFHGKIVLLHNDINWAIRASFSMYVNTQFISDPFPGWGKGAIPRARFYRGGGI